ncbi:MAG TPA: M56 family metallopeptidase [Candidatus Dormibacteraeota bacterium]|jgi:beta-lactamase regulating signal transducer with metallopeptidase domain|nr:M56 family metallopeptidase [Candidatus Dormibacteraeota bacterium]
MRAEISLHFAAIFLSYFVKVTAAYFACWMLNRLLAKPRQRFIACMVFLVGSAAYWLELVVREFRDSGAGTAEVANAQVSASNVTHSFLVPVGWSHSILIGTQALGAVYVLVSLTLIGMWAWKHFRMRALLRHAIEPSASLDGFFTEVSREIGRSQSAVSSARLMVLPGLKSPATAGCWNPRILLPAVCEQIGPTPQVGDVLCHELVHVARHDYLWAGLSDLICCLLFFHPAAWRARRAMTLQGELACDQAVLETRPGDRADYADSLTYFVRLRMLQDGFSLGVDFAASTSLGLRIRTILTTPTPTAWWKACSRMVAGLSVVATFGVLAPAMTLFLGFAEPLIEQASSRPPLQTAAEHSRNSRHISRRVTAQVAPRDSLTTLRTRPYVSETPAYTMTSRTYRPNSERLERESPVWRETQPTIQYPSVSSVVRTTLGEIAARGAHPGRSHDRDDH